MIRKLIPPLVCILGIINLLQAINEMSSLSTISPLLLCMLAAILIYWVFVNIVIYKRADKKRVVAMLIIVPLALTILVVIFVALTEKMIAIRQIVNILGFINTTGVMITAAIFLWNQLFPKAYNS